MAVIKETTEDVIRKPDKYKRKNWNTTSILSCIILLLVICLTVYIVYERKHSKCFHEKSIENSPITAELIANNNSSGETNFINRTEWGGAPPVETTLLKTPVPNVIILHTTTNDCTDQKSCSSIVRNIQYVHTRILRWWDIGYSFLIGGDGNIYEGRGWKNEGAFAYGYNSISIGIAFIGNFNHYLPGEKSLIAAKALIEEGVQNGFIVEEYNLFGQRQFAHTLNPGEMLYENIKTWPHWNQTVFYN